MTDIKNYSEFKSRLNLRSNKSSIYHDFIESFQPVSTSAPVAQSVSAPYLQVSARSARICGGCEFEPHLEHIFFRNFFPRLTDLFIRVALELQLRSKYNIITKSNTTKQEQILYERKCRVFESGSHCLSRLGTLRSPSSTFLSLRLVTEWHVYK